MKWATPRKKIDFQELDFFQGGDINCIIFLSLKGMF
jgi:hypothetical protein